MFYNKKFKAKNPELNKALMSMIWVEDYYSIFYHIVINAGT
jgi:hypothetical protein